eukprot:1154109-Pelagomonas_calceolata.AAC.1
MGSAPFHLEATMIASMTTEHKQSKEGTNVLHSSQLSTLITEIRQGVLLGTSMATERWQSKERTTVLHSSQLLTLITEISSSRSNKGYC